MPDAMTRRERDDLARLVRRREHVAKTGASERSAELLADFERQMATIYKAEDDAWKDVTIEAKRLVAEADAEIARRCRELGIPEDLRPGLQLGFYGRGQNASRERRAELRQVAARRIAAIEKQARSEIERASVEIQTQLLAGGLETDAARSFLAAMPTIDALMPPLDAEAVAKGLPWHKPETYGRLGRGYGLADTEGAADE
jgi:hypothetical protein